MQKEHKKNYWLKSGILNLFQNFSGAFFGVVGLMILARMLTTEQMGTWALFLGVGSIMEMVRNGLVQNAVIKFVASQPAEESKVMSAALTVSGILTLACIMFLACFGGWLSHQLRASPANQLLMEQMFYLYIIIFIVSGILTQLCCIEQAHLSYKGVVACNFVRGVIFFAYLVGCAVINHIPGLLEMVCVQIIGVVLAVVTSWFYVRHYIIFSYHFSMEWVKKIFHYGKYAFGTSVSSLLSGNVDQWMIGNIMNPASVASFRVAIQVTNLIDIPTNTIATIVFPQSAKRMETEGKTAVCYLYERSVGAILAVLIPGISFMYIFDKVIMSILAGDKYVNAVPILNVTLLYALLIPFGRQFGAILDSIGKTRTTFIIVVVTTVINLLLNFFFIKKWGALGAAYATFCSNIIGFVIAQRILYKELGVTWYHPFIFAFHFYSEFYKDHLKKYLVKGKIK